MGFVSVKYFGMIAEKTGKEIEQISFEEVGNHLTDLKTYCEKSYPGMGDIKYQIAINKCLGSKEVLQEGDEVAFLPPFAGG
ncbi:MoaD/ThiS family protein [Marinoscillum sp. MHG1-6]|uniref:MoaD/ThiS family protein n=1 Tax=Marinoscillum sp. MHG1-6 TaxID=2959627 RepID=UPI0021589A88|nr:MoaD/ThiS family protein [Marinoscillum sp. MHG1-6]